jgi:hypothetical protein
VDGAAYARILSGQDKIIRIAICNFYAEHLGRIDTKVISFLGADKKLFFQKARFHSEV